eukprot:5744441-Pleurochrysis_carterae.AAC.1
MVAKGAAGSGEEGGRVEVGEEAKKLAKPDVGEDKAMELDVCTDTEPEDASDLEDKSDSEESEESDSSAFISDSDALFTPP